jgi:hypothetical protein
VKDIPQPSKSNGGTASSAMKAIDDCITEANGPRLLESQRTFKLSCNLSCAFALDRIRAETLNCLGSWEN